MQFFILFVGAMVFVFYQFVAPPLSFNKTQADRLRASQYSAEFTSLEAAHARIFEAKREAATRVAASNDSAAVAELRTLQQQDEAIRKQASDLIRKNDPKADAADTDYIFLTFIIQNLPTGLVGVLMAAIFCAAMSANAGGLNALASTSVVDIWKRLLWPGRPDHHYVVISKLMTVFWGLFCISFAWYANRLGSLIVAVNQVGSLFYGTMLAIFLVAFYFPRVGGTAVFWGAVISEAAIFYCKFFTKVAWLWWNVVGCVVGVGAAILIQKIVVDRLKRPSTT
jgi:Na+(H+)/acetate symporter ActP